MVYVGFGVLAASLSYLIYRHGFTTWSRMLRFCSGPNDAARGIQHSSQISKPRLENADTVSSKEDSQEQIKYGDEDIQLKSPQVAYDSQGATTQTSQLVPSFKIDGDISAQNNIEKVFEKSPQNNQGVNRHPASSAPSPAQAQETTSIAMPPPPRPNQTSKRKPSAPTSSLMPPPSQTSSKTPSLRPLPRAPSTLQPPPSAASSLRPPPSRSLGSSPPSLAPSTSTLAPANRPSKKVVLDPGHSPLDWAHLTKHPPTPTFLRGAAVPPALIRVPPSLLRHHNGRKGKDAWGVWQGKVYNLTPYLKFHPGGVDELKKAAGRERDGERLFMEVHPWVSWESMLGECLVGVLGGEEDAKMVNEGSRNPLDEMD